MNSALQMCFLTIREERGTNTLCFFQMFSMR